MSQDNFIATNNIFDWVANPTTDWSTGAVPQSTQDASIGTSSSANGATVVSSANETVNSIVTAKGFDVLDIDNSSTFTATDGSGPNTNFGTIEVFDADLVDDGTVTNAGVILLDTDSTNVTSIYLVTTNTTLTGGGSLEMNIIGAEPNGNFIAGSGEHPAIFTNKNNTISGTGTILDLVFINDGTIETNNSTSSNGGTLVIFPGAGSFTNNFIMRIDVGGTLEFGADNVSTTIDNEGSIVFAAATNTLTILEIAGNVTIDGSGKGVVAMASSGGVDTFDEITSDGKPASLTLLNQTFRGGGFIGDSTDDDLTLTNGPGSIIESTNPAQALVLQAGTITNAGEIEGLTETLIENPGGNSPAAINNSGILVANGGILAAVGDLSNSGTITSVAGGDFLFGGSMTGSGTVSIGDDGTMSLVANTSVAGNITFTGPDALFALAPDCTIGDIVGATATDAIDEAGIPFAVGEHAVWQEDAANTGGTLSLVNNNGNVLATVNLIGQFTSLNFAVSLDRAIPMFNPQGGGSLITVLNSPPPAATTADMIMSDGSDGALEIFDLGNNAILTADTLGQIDPKWQVAGVGGFDGTDTSDMIVHDSSGDLQVEDVSNNNIIGSAPMGAVGLPWAVSGFGDFSGNPGETDMLMQNSATGQFEVFDIRNNAITNAVSMGAVGAPWVVAGFGDFSGHAGETGDMLMRNGSTGAFEVFDIADNTISFSAGMGSVGLEWTVAGFGDFSGNANETDMLMRDSNTGEFEIFDIGNNQITFSASIGAVGLEWSVVGFGPINGAGTSDMLMQGTGTGAFEVFDITNNQLTTAASMGAVGLAWSVAGIAADPPGSPPANTQLAQAMASFGSNSGSLDTSSPSTPPAALPAALSLLTAASNQPQPA